MKDTIWTHGICYFKHWFRFRQPCSKFGCFFCLWCYFCQEWALVGKRIQKYPKNKGPRRILFTNQRRFWNFVLSFLSVQWSDKFIELQKGIRCSFQNEHLIFLGTKGLDWTEPVYSRQSATLRGTNPNSPTRPKPRVASPDAASGLSCCQWHPRGRFCMCKTFPNYLNILRYISILISSHFFLFLWAKVA